MDFVNLCEELSTNPKNMEDYDKKKVLKVIACLYKFNRLY